MPASLTSSFASAAAGGNNEGSSTRRDGSNIHEWSKSRSNGATQTFRRSSQVTSTQSRDNNPSTNTSSSTGTYVPPHLNNQQAVTRNGMSGDTRYSKDQLLSIYQHQRDNGILNRDLEDLFQGSWSPLSRNIAAQGRSDGKDAPVGPDVCWHTQVEAGPLSLTEMDEDEKQLFTSSVNSTLKMNQTKDGSTIGTRKSSISNHAGAYNATSNANSRPGTRRRETSESYSVNGPLSPPEGKTTLRTDFGANTPPPALLRRRTDMRDEDIRAENKNGEGGEQEGQTPFGSLRRLATGPLSAGPNGPSATPWSSVGPRSAFESMGGFGSFSAGGAAIGQEPEKRPGFGSARGGSRFKDLLRKSSAEDMSPVVKEKSSVSALEKLPEESNHDEYNRMKESLRTRQYRSETNPYEESISRTGSAALSHDEPSIEQLGFSTFGPGDSQSTPAMRRTHDGPSPTHTNPYHSPAVQRSQDENADELEGQAPGFQTLGSARRDMFAGALPPTTFGGSRPGLGGLGTISGWGGPSLGSGTPVRERSNVSAAFGDPIFSPMATDLQSPGGGFFGSAGFGSAGRSNRLGALFPPVMQDQMRSESRNDGFEASTEQLGGRDPFDSNSRRNEALRSLFDDNSVRPNEQQFAGQTGPPAPSVATPGGNVQRGNAGADQISGTTPTSSSANTLPTAQQRQMVMPDRMRWIYRDPQGNVQGPWSGLEMHDWFKAGFFTAELQVKKLEDGEYEPLAQLVRRIGNSREPFLVPQIGVPHGPPSTSQGNQWANNIGSGGGTQPPFANNFPSFGTTLTAEQQNALERRKQEEQYLMARQKEHLAQQQIYMKQIQMQNPSSNMHGLQHHSSAHSLQSQPSFGSITSPGGYHHSPMQGPIQPPQTISAYAQPPSAQQQAQSVRDDELPGVMDRLSFSQRTNMPFGTSPIGQQPVPGGNGQTGIQEPGQAIDQHRDLRTHEETFLGHGGRNDRLEEFEELRRQIDDNELDTSLRQPIGPQRIVGDNDSGKSQMPIGSTMKLGRQDDTESLSLTQQVQRRAAANEKAAAAELTLDPPPVSASPLPAPTPNRNRQHVADQLAAESRSQTQTPVEPASMAPWAQAELPKGPSLKEIQEAEAKRAAEQEALLAAARRAQAEQERIAAATVIVPAPGLPASSNWASSMSPASPGPTSSVWGAKQPTKPAAGVVASKKTLAQIQKEEEVKKQKAAAQLAATQTQNQTTLSSSGVGGKRYAELAGKTASPGPQTTNNSWIPVGSSGKPKTPAAVVAAPQGTRTVSTGSNVPLLPKSRPALQTRTTSVSNKSRADEEFIKWAKSQLSNELNAGINPDSFIRNLLELPAEKEILREALYASSQTINGDRVSEEWVRRRRLADKGIIEPVAELNSLVATDNRNAGWSEVAKKNPVKEDTSTAQAFKVVSKKKGKK